MSVGVPDRLQSELLEVVALATPSADKDSLTKGYDLTTEQMVELALKLWAQRGNPVNDGLDRMIERAVRNTVEGTKSEYPTGV